MQPTAGATWRSELDAVSSSRLDRVALPLTVLMTVYYGTTREEFDRAVSGVLEQTLPADEFLIVADGPLTPEVGVALVAAEEHQSVRVLRLPVNVGSGTASQHGLAEAQGEFVARQDADDVSLPHRLEREMAAIRDRGLDMVGSAMLEFIGSPDNLIGIRGAPSDLRAILRRARMNNPINNPTVVFRRELALEVGGYSDLRYMQDYDLFVRMLLGGAQAANLSEPLVMFNVGNGMLARRAGPTMLKHEWALQQQLIRNGMVGRLGAARNLVLRGTFRMLPAPLLERAYAWLFRRRAVRNGRTP